MMTMRRVFAGVVLCGVAAALLAGLVKTPGSAAQSREPELVVYSGPNFTGESMRLTQSAFDLLNERDARAGEQVWNDRIRSMIVVSGTWVIYQNGRGNTVIDDTPLESLDIREKAPDKGWSCLVSATSTGTGRVWPMQHDEESSALPATSPTSAALGVAPPPNLEVVRSGGSVLHHLHTGICASSDLLLVEGQRDPGARSTVGHHPGRHQ